MRTVFLARSEKQGRDLRDLVHREARKGGRLAEDASVDDWTIIGDRHLVSDRIDEYRERLGVSHMIVTRLRISGVERRDIESSVAQLAEIVF